MTNQYYYAADFSRYAPILRTEVDQQCSICHKTITQHTTVMCTISSSMSSVSNPRMSDRYYLVCEGGL